ncbi:MAG: DcaP family trimeric outer membrane transporter [Terriglobales bacterium]
MKFNRSRVSTQLVVVFTVILLFVAFGGIIALAQTQAPVKDQTASTGDDPEKTDISPVQDAGTAPPQASPPIPEEDKNSLELYGFAQADMGFNFGQEDPNWFDVMRPTKLDSFQDQFAPSGTWFFSVRQTRFGAKTTTATPLGELKTIFEFDFFGVGADAGQTTIRPRYFYGELGQFGAGQTITPFMDLDVFPNILDYWGPNGMVFFRNVQIRWMPKKGKNRITFAVEKPGASADGGTAASMIDLSNVRAHFNVPEFTGEARFANKLGYIKLSGLFSYFSYTDLAATSTQNISGSVPSWGINVSSNVKFTSKDVARLQVIYGQGCENYMNDAPLDVGPKLNPGNSVTPIKGEALPVLGAVAFVDHDWNKKFSSAIGGSMVNIWNSNAELPSDFHQGYYGIANLLYSPIKNLMMGGEAQYGRRVNFSDGFNVNDYKVQLSFKYSYSHIFNF